MTLFDQIGFGATALVLLALLATLVVAVLWVLPTILSLASG